MKNYDLLAKLDPVRFAKLYLRLHLDPWQVEAVRHRRVILNCCRQSGKTTAAALAAVHHMLFTAKADVMVVSATEAQAGETVQRILQFLAQLGEEVRRHPGRRFEYELIRTGARFRALPCREASVRGYTATFIIIDEAARVPDDVYHALTGTLATTWHRAGLWIISTPRERRGFYYDLYTGPSDDGFLRLKITAHECSRITPEFLEQQRRKLPEWRFKQEYECEFGDTALTVITAEDIKAACDAPNAPHLSAHHIEFLGAPPSRFLIGLDHAQTNDHPALTVLQHRPELTSQNPVTLQNSYRGQLLIRHLQRLPTGIHYPDLVNYIRRLLAFPEIQRNGAELIVDGTAANAFIDYLRVNPLGASLIPVIVTASGDETLVNGKYHVPKGVLFHNLQFLFRNRNLKIAPGAGHVEEFKQELAAMKRIVSPTGYDLFVPTAGQPDDMVNSAALAAWWAMRKYRSSLLKEVA